MLYVKVLLEGMAALPVADAAVRDAIALEAAALGWPALHVELARVDPVAAARIHPNHSQRIQRALEVFRISGRPISDWQQANDPGVASHRLVNLALAPVDRGVLHARIAQRFRQMLEQGLVAEVEALYRRGDLHPDLPSIRAVGYRQVWSYLAGETDADQMLEQGIAATRQLAKRQLTWLRGWPGLKQLPTDASQRVESPPGAMLPPGIGTGTPIIELALKYLDESP
jgi:tRNA dimethylallyltransferase